MTQKSILFIKTLFNKEQHWINIDIIMTWYYINILYDTKIRQKNVIENHIVDVTSMLVTDVGTVYVGDKFEILVTSSRF